MSDNKSQSQRLKPLDLAEINREFRAIAALNGWGSYHNPKNLTAALAVEVGELLAEFQWLTPAQASHLTALQKSRVEAEIADVILYLSELCVSLGIEAADAVQAKIEINRNRFKKI